ncbi:MAG: adenylyltransferase, partial [Candidatus Sedimenticola sp. 6PFRAG1]
MDMKLHRHGEYELVELLVNEDRAEQLKKTSLDFKSLTLSHRQLCDLELLLNGAFTPLTGFLGRADYESVVDRMRLADGTLWPMPITLDVPLAFAQQIVPGETIALRDHEGFMPAVLTVTEKWQPDKHR